MQRLAILLSALLVLISFAAPGSAQPRQPLSLHPDNPRYLLFRDKPTILITSTEHYGAVMNLDFDYVPYLDELKSKNLNLTRTFSGTYHEIHGTFNITDNTLAPRPERYLSPWPRTTEPGAADGNKFDLTKWDDKYFARLKDFVSQAAQRGIVVEYVLFCPFYEQPLWDVNPMNAKNNVNGVGTCPRNEVYTLKHKDLLEVHLAFVRKAVAELAVFDNVYFEICNEPYFGGVTEEWQAKVSETIADAEKALPENRRHLIAQNIANDKKKVERPDPRVSIFNFHYATPPDTVEMNYGLKKVIGDDETGFRGKSDAVYRGEGWDFILAGGAIYDNLDYSFTPKTCAGTLRDYQSPGGGSPELRDQLGILRKFMEGFEFVKMKPMNEIVKGGTVEAPLAGGKPATAHVTVRVLGEEGRQYAIYVRGGTSAEVRVSLPAGKYRAQWLDTRTGQVETSEDFAHAADVIHLRSPRYAEDAALSIKATK